MDDLPLVRVADVVRRLEPGRDFDLDGAARNVFLTEAGSHRVEDLLGCGNLFDEPRVPLLAAVRILFAWGLYLRWRRRRAASRG